MRRLPDELEVELVDERGGVLGRLLWFTSFEITLSMDGPSEASFEIGDDGTYNAIGQYVAAGARYQVRLNGRPLLRGYVEGDDLPHDPQSGAVVRFVVRSSMAQASFQSATPVGVQKTTLSEFVFKLYAQVGIHESDFIVRASLARELLTGKRTKSAKRASGNDEVKLRQLTVDEARVRPPETVYSAVDRHLRRFGLMHWDGPDGKIVIGAPDDTQDAIYVLSAFRDKRRSQLNNTLGATRTLDYSQVPSTLGVYGVGGGKNISRARIVGFTQDADVVASGLRHNVIVPAESIHLQSAAVVAARREMLQRSRRKDELSVELDGLSWWNPQAGERVPWAPDTVAVVQSDTAGGDLGAYYLHTITMRRDAARGDVSTLQLSRRGVWRLEPEVYEGAASAGGLLAL